MVWSAIERIIQLERFRRPIIDMYIGRLLALLGFGLPARLRFLYIEGGQESTGQESTNENSFLLL